MPYERDERLARPWAIPGTPGLEHRIGGLEKQDVTGNVSYDPDNHEHMVRHPGPKGGQHRQGHPAAEARRPGQRRLARVELGRDLRRVCHGCPHDAGLRSRGDALPPPLPESAAQANLGDILKRFKKVLIPELNMGQLRLIIRDKYLIDAIGLNKVQGKPFSVAEVEAKIEELVTGKPSAGATEIAASGEQGGTGGDCGWRAAARWLSVSVC